jgi:hypothetical protein
MAHGTHERFLYSQIDEAAQPCVALQFSSLSLLDDRLPISIWPMHHKELFASLPGTLNCQTAQSFHFAAVNYTEDGTTCQSMTILYVRLQTHPVQLNAALLEIKHLMMCAFF